jgi:hypothetical protein
MKLGKATTVLAVIFMVNACVSGAFADEKLSGLNSALSNSTISGSVLSFCDFGDSSVVTGDVIGSSAAVPVSFAVSSVPEPASSGLLAAGILMLAIFARAKRPSLISGR